MPSARFFRVLFLLMPLLLIQTIFAEDSDDYKPAVTARVARISFLRGDVKIKRADSQDWERAVLNLPLVEGDQIATDFKARVEIQFDRDSFLRLAENSYLKIPTLRDEGIALSLPQGTLSLRVLDFDKSRSYFEIDAPQTTLSVQKIGLYRVDAGNENADSLRVTATDGGEARIYSENSGFTLRNGRSSLIYLGGNYAGEWETSDASRYADDWDRWVLERDAKTAQKLRDAYYDRYYDRDIYGAEDLNEYGEWIQTRKYGWVWRPYRATTSSYADWSPYRYGHWRWLPPYGWTWVNDEPWGWATYHHGRWIYHDNGWIWSPYGYHRPRRSWWNPALVVVTYSGNLICWYPLPYQYQYYDYNRNYYSKYVDKRKYYNTTINNTTVIVNPTPTPAPSGTPIIQVGKTPMRLDVPPGGIIAVNREDFGIWQKRRESAPTEIANKILSKEPSFESPPLLPVGIEEKVRAKSEILVEKPRGEKFDSQVKTGVIERTPGISPENEIRRTKIFNERTPLEPRRKADDDTEINSSQKERTERDTGAIRRVSRPKENADENNSETGGQSPIRRKTDEETAPVRKPREPQPVSQPRRKSDENQSPPYSPAPPREKKREEPRFDPPSKQREEPRYNPPPKQREEPSRKQEQRIEPPRKNDDSKQPDKKDNDN